jgi:hypothetical protein
VRPPVRWVLHIITLERRIRLSPRANIYAYVLTSLVFALVFAAGSKPKELLYIAVSHGLGTSQSAPQLLSPAQEAGEGKLEHVPLNSTWSNFREPNKYVLPDRRTVSASGYRGPKRSVAAPRRLRHDRYNSNRSRNRMDRIYRRKRGLGLTQ